MTGDKGFTLMELIVAVGIFTIVILFALRTFDLTIKGQQNAIASQKTQESIRYFFEVASKELRMAQKDDGVCADVSDLKVYETNASGTEIYFKNYKNQCVTYKLESNNGVNRFKIIRDLDSGYITPRGIDINKLSFTVIDNIANTQSMVTMFTDLEAVAKQEHKNRLKIQTSISSRYYE